MSTPTPRTIRVRAQAILNTLETMPGYGTPGTMAAPVTDTEFEDMLEEMTGTRSDWDLTSPESAIRSCLSSVDPIARRL
jgi:hypothetical protein